MSLSCDRLGDKHTDLFLHPSAPEDVPIWPWLFEPPHSTLSKIPSSNAGGFTDAETNEHISYPDLKEFTTLVSTALKRNYGLQQGDTVVIYGRNSIWYPVIALSALRVGAIACGVSPDYTVEELVYSLRLSKAKFIFASINGLPNAQQAASKAGIPARNVLLIDGPGSNGETRARDLVEQGRHYTAAEAAEPYQLPAGKTNKEVCAWLCFSSGTTGLPKAVMISHANVIAQCLQVHEIISPDHRRILAALPFYHITGIVHQLHLPIMLNARVYVLAHFTLDKMLKTVADNKILEVLLVPPILIRLVREPSISAKYDLSHIRRFSSGAAPLSREILDLLEKQFPGTGFKQGYGMTESCSAITVHPPSKFAYKYAHKVGMIVSSTEVKIVDPDSRKECQSGEPGEIWARGPQMAMGYLDNPKATAETFDDDGFLHTGDIGTVDDEGLLHITDRMKEMIKVKGIGVAPAELEDFLLGHPLVRDVAVCGIADERAGERPKAFVVLKDESPTSLVGIGHQLLAFVKSNKARHKCLAEVEFVHEIPKSAAGKILRRKLRQAAQSAKGVVVRDEQVRARL